MFVVTNRIFVSEGFEDEFEERFKRRAGQIDKQPGFVSLRVLRPLSEKTPYVIETTWENESVFKQWVDSEDFREAHKNKLPAEATLAGGGLERFAVVVCAEK